MAKKNVQLPADQISQQSPPPPRGLSAQIYRFNPFHPSGPFLAPKLVIQ